MGKLTEAQKSFLEYLAMRQPVEDLGLSGATVKMVQRLHGRGLIDRGVRRSIAVWVITPAGRAALSPTTDDAGGTDGR